MGDLEEREVLKRSPSRNVSPSRLHLRITCRTFQIFSCLLPLPYSDCDLIGLGWVLGIYSFDYSLVKNNIVLNDKVSITYFKVSYC